MQQEQIKRVAAGAHDIRFNGSAYIFREGTEAEHFYVLRAGTVALEINAAERGSVTIETIGAGDVLGWSWLFPPYTWHFSARALEPVHAVAIGAEALRAQCETDHDFGYELMRRFAAVFLERLQATRLRLLDIYGPPVRAAEMKRGRA
jgi:CRP-like cAMP-binding protein